jgi:hypothetical protein
VSWFPARLVVAASMGAVGIFGPMSSGAALAAPEQSTGFDISYPQCSRTLPTRPGFGVVGVNGGLAYSANPCLASEYTWASAATSATQPHVSFYLNTGNPGPVASSHWPRAGTRTPQACDGSWNAACAYDYGWDAASDSFARAAAPGVAGPNAAKAPWWLDVEVANSWAADTTLNTADLRGAVAFLQSAGVSTIGIYASTSSWAQITGATSAKSTINAPFSGLLNWVPGARSAKDAQNRCTQTFTGGRVKLVQYPNAGFDGDLACF